MSYAELVAATNFSFLRGASHPSDMVAEAMALGYTAIGIADRNSVAGVVRAYKALRDAPEKARIALIEEKRAQGAPLVLSEEEEAGCRTDLRLLVGARLVFTDGTPDIVAYPMTRRGWGRLTRLLTAGNLQAVKGDCILELDNLLAHLDDLLLIVLPHSTATDQTPHRKPVPYDSAAVAPETTHLRLVEALPRDLSELLARLSAKAPGRVWLGAAMHHRGDDQRRLARLASLARSTRVPMIAVGDALYATPEQRPLHDVLTCIREGTTIAEAGRRLEINAERHLKQPAEMMRLFRRFPEAIEETTCFASRIDFTLDQLNYEYPHEPVPDGWAPQDWLEHLVIEAAHARYGDDLPEKIQSSLTEEFDLIRNRGYAYYFLTVHDLVKFARSQEPPILCQGRGSAANSIVCFLLGVTSIDPIKHDLLFSRFMSSDRNEPPDIDVDFEHERREEVMQYVYKRYGRHRAGVTATVIHYRPKSAVREVGKVLGFSEDVTAQLASTAWGSYEHAVEERRFAENGLDLADPAIARLRWLVGELLQFPRHLSQHVGGFVLTQDRLDETVPIHHAAMDDRSFIEWDKDDIDTLGLMKVDVLALGMLTCIRKSFDLMRAHGLGDHNLEVDLEAGDEAVYDMLCKGDSIGVFQVESRAQINMLPRLKPRTLYDLTIQVAIVRPGPIEGDMVHPYLRRRSGVEKVDYPSPALPHDPNELRSLLGATYGVPLFQEQAMKLAIVAAGFTSSEANQLRRAMATFRNVGTIDQFREKMVGGMMRRGYGQDFAERCFKQIEGFGSYGFPESHALSFARLVYVSAWLKCHQPAVFAAALLNSQPMGFYAPAQIVRDAREKGGVEVRAIDVNASGWDNGLESSRHAGLVPASNPARASALEARWTPEQVRGDGPALRLGLRQIDGFREDWAIAIAAARGARAFASIEDLARRAALPQRALRLLADADAFRSLGLDRRAALWEVRRTPAAELPLFAAAAARELGAEPDVALPAMSTAEHVVTDYQTTRLSLKDHPMAFLRATLAAEGVLSCAETDNARNDAFVRTAGIVLIRQRPGKGNAIFITIEDETGITNIVLWARQFEMWRRAVMASRLMLVEGRIQRSREGVVHLMASRIVDRTDLLDHLSEADVAPVGPDALSRHPRNVRIVPKSRDFH
ncbi:DnaE-like error-prone DNA polymerase [Hephaestia caeni]|uniref:Error-prone DNA polymerase n=1 Tax=Hephaestia caeni TaxID=645617 RepID=A0A397P4E0_9SPHN|nr:error-prone DNA polymerase [Hephaestia caeni]RIA43728.1 DnaE-like error-prone DNA polymerase [Hephaestia caeni]